MKKLERCLRSIIKRSGNWEIANVLCILFAALFSLLIDLRGAVWLLGVIAICDMARFVLCGAWFHAPFHRTAHYWCPQKDLIYKIGMVAKIMFYLILALASVVIFIVPSDAVMTTAVICLYLIVVISVLEAMRTLAHVLNKYDYSWLKETVGEYGAELLNISIGTAICFINVHIIATDYFGAYSMIIAGGFIVFYLLLVEMLSYCLQRAHQLRTITRAFVWYENFTQKLFFISHTVIIIIAMACKGIKLNNCNVAWFLSVMAAVAIMKDILMAVWHLMGKWHLNYATMYSYRLNVARRWISYCWILVGMASIASGSAELAALSALFLFIVAISSIICLVYDISIMNHPDRYNFEEPY